MICLAIMLLLVYKPPKKEVVDPAGFGLLGIIELLFELPIFYSFANALLKYL